MLVKTALLFPVVSLLAALSVRCNGKPDAAASTTLDVKIQLLTDKILSDQQPVYIITVRNPSPKPVKLIRTITPLALVIYRKGESEGRSAIILDPQTSSFKDNRDK